jgi:hypothetical protein
VLQDNPTVTLKNQQEFLEEQKAQIDRLLYIVYALLGLAVVIAVLGVTNTLALSVIERTREVGLLREIGLGRRQLRRMIRLESIAISLLGAVLGVAMGVDFGIVLQRAVWDHGVDVLSIPWRRLAVFVALSVVGGRLAVVSRPHAERPDWTSSTPSPPSSQRADASREGLRHRARLVRVSMCAPHGFPETVAVRRVRLVSDNALLGAPDDSDLGTSGRSRHCGVDAAARVDTVGALRLERARGPAHPPRQLLGVRGERVPPHRSLREPRRCRGRERRRSRSRRAR